MQAYCLGGGRILLAHSLDQGSERADSEARALDPMIIPPAGAPPEAPAGASAGGPHTPILPFEDVPFPLFQIDGGCIITRWNDALVELTGVCRDVAIGSTYEGLIAELHISHEYRTAAIARASADATGACASATMRTCRHTPPA